MIFRLSQKLNAKIKGGTLASVPLQENPLVDWSAHLFTADGTQYILLSNTTSLYSTVMFGKGITHDSGFISRAISGIRELMEFDGQLLTYHRFLVPATGSVRFAKALGRSVTGSMNELVAQASDWLADGDVSPFDVGFKLNETLFTALAEFGQNGYGTPGDAWRVLVSRAANGDVQLGPEALN